MSKLAVGYVRRSTSMQEQSLGDQRRDIEEFAKRQGFRILQFYEDDAVSGVDTSKRAGFGEMLNDARQPSRAWDSILVYDVKRFGRADSDETGHIRYLLREAGVEVIYTSEGFGDDSSAEILRNVKQCLAHEESRGTSKTTLRGQRTTSERGCWSGGSPPYGYDLSYASADGKLDQIVRFLPSGEKLVLDPETGEVRKRMPKGERVTHAKSDQIRLCPSLPERVATVVRIFEMYIDGAGFKAIANRLNDLDIPSPRNSKYSPRYDGRWAMASIRAIIKNRAYRGDSVWNRSTSGKFHRLQGGEITPRPKRSSNRLEKNAEDEWIIVEGAHEPIVPPALFDRAQNIGKGRERVGHKRSIAGTAKTSPYLLSGIVKCKRCGHSFQGMKTRKGKKRVDGSTVETFNYICGGYRTKGNKVCTKVLIPRDLIEDEVMAIVKRQLDGYLETGGREKLIANIELILGPDGGLNPKDELPRAEARIAALDEKADNLLDLISADNRDAIDRKLRTIRDERIELVRKRDELQAAIDSKIDPEEVTTDIIAHLANFSEVMAQGSPEERKMFIRAFIDEVVIDPDGGEGGGEAGAVVYLKQVPLIGSTSGTRSLQVVAGTGFTSEQSREGGVRRPWVPLGCLRGRILVAAG